MLGILFEATDPKWKLQLAEARTSDEEARGYGIVPEAVNSLARRQWIDGLMELGLIDLRSNQSCLPIVIARQPSPCNKSRPQGATSGSL
jgi:hypothetical protein